MFSLMLSGMLQKILYVLYEKAEINILKLILRGY